MSEPQPGEVAITLPAGPGHERLSTDVVARGALAAALSRRLGRSVTLSVTGESSPAKKAAEPPRRLTPELVKEEKLARLSGADPLLKTAVDEWHLELLD